MYEVPLTKFTSTQISVLMAYDIFWTLQQHDGHLRKGFEFFLCTSETSEGPGGGYTRHPAIMYKIKGEGCTVCRTRWIERIDAMETFKNMHPSVVACMEQICNQGPSQWSTDSLTDARALLLAITTTDFLSALVITTVLLGYLRPLTVSLQAEAKDIIAATREIDTVKATIQDLRDNIDVHHEEWYV